jgi:hypothetical protein
MAADVVGMRGLHALLVLLSPIDVAAGTTVGELNVSKGTGSPLTASTGELVFERCVETTVAASETDTVAGKIEGGIAAESCGGAARNDATISSCCSIGGGRIPGIPCSNRTADEFDRVDQIKAATISGAVVVEYITLQSREVLSRSSSNTK